MMQIIHRKLNKELAMNALETILKMNEIALNEDLGKAGRAQAQLESSS